MFSLADFQQKQIVFIKSKHVKQMQFANDNLVVKEDDQIVSKVSCHKIFCVFLPGDATITTCLIKKFLDYGISLILMNRNLSVYTVIGAETEGNYLLRKKQYLLINTLDIAKDLIANKAQNQLLLLKSIRGKSEKVKTGIQQIVEIMEKIKIAKANQELMGIEGIISKVFFQNYFVDLGWRGRKPRTKFDSTNTLMDIGYTYLFNYIEALLKLFGFDVYMGVYHQLFYQRKSLVCDLVEPFRCIIDKQILKSFNLGQINEKDFKIKGDQYNLKYEETGKYTKIFIEAIMEHRDEIYKYIHQYYYVIIRDDPNFPQFFIKQ